MMKSQNAALHVMRVGTAITFLWIGVLIFAEPEGWGSVLQPWAVELLPFGIREAMITTAIFDIVAGLFLLLDRFVAGFAFLGALHILTVIITVGVDSFTVRDISILASTVALTIAYWPKSLLPGLEKK